jgi:hypothetical protein
MAVVTDLAMARIARAVEAQWVEMQATEQRGSFGGIFIVKADLR